MKPDDLNDRRSVTPLIPQRSPSRNPRVPSRGSVASAQAAVAIARTQLDNVYDATTATAADPTPQAAPVADESVNQAALEMQNPYDRTQANLAHIQAERWKQYHSAWQDYYQKYYERYYVGQVYHAKQALEARAAEARLVAPDQSSQTMPQSEIEPEILSRDEAMYDLHKRLLGKVRDSAKKVRKSRHFIPITAAIAVVLLFMFLQYNSLLIGTVEAYVSPGDIDPANIIVDPSTDITVSPDPRLIIPKINVDVPVDYNTTPDYNSQMAAMQNGLAYFGIPGADSKPGQVGNTVLSGHSSNDITDQGDYKFIFAQLSHLANGDTIYVNYQSKRYTYTVTSEAVVQPTDVSKLVYPTTKPLLTLITCTPLGTSLNRLLVTAEQVSPDPKTALPAPATNSTSSTAPTSIPGTAPTLIQRLLGQSGN
jgi:LPXTG-site transpeptidase (sortase) family protein